jgi:hypothetical protein
MTEQASDIIDTEAEEAAERFQARLAELKSDLRRELAGLSDPQAKALFETAAETLGGLENAFAHFQSKTEEAWRPSAAVLGI